LLKIVVKFRQNLPTLKLYRNLCEAVITGLSDTFEEGKYADKVIEKILKSNPKWGARDRRFIAETMYDIVRWKRLFSVLAEVEETDYWKLLAVWCLWNKTEYPDWDELKNVDRKKVLARYEEVKGIRKISESIPDWLDEVGERELGPKWDKELAALNEEAKVVLRVNTLKVSRAVLQHQLEQEENILTEAPEAQADALLLAERQNIFTRQQFKDGLFEVQDGGSQMIAPFLQVKPGMRVIDACAGAGGKTLHLAALMQNKGRIIALDTEGWKLEELKKRGRRAGVANVETRLIESSKTIKRLEKSADRLLLDVPCSGLGVLKRNPDAKWKLSAEFIDRVKELQQQILTDYTSMLKPGGMVVYSTCSLFPSENEQQVEKFLKANPNKFELQEQKTILPSAGFDGFFMARMKKVE
jgi:16S rRNA (cytosine967-C5)-methyltransferase